MIIFEIRTEYTISILHHTLSDIYTKQESNLMMILSGSMMISPRLIWYTLQSWMEVRLTNEISSQLSVQRIEQGFFLPMGSLVEAVFKTLEPVVKS